MPKVLCLTGMVVAILVLVLFVLDLVLKFPFQRFSMFMDVMFILSAAGIGYLSWSTYRELD